MIACLLIPDLISHIEGRNPERAGKPIILTTARGMVQGASREAVHDGVRLGMRKRQAHSLSPNACVLPLDDTPYLEITEAIGDMLQDFTSKIELIAGFWQGTQKNKKKTVVTPHSSGAIYYLDLGKLKRTDALFLVNQLQEAVRITFGMSIYVGLASNKFTAGAAVRLAQPDHPKFIRLGFEGRFLSSLSVIYLPLDKETARRLYLLGIKTLGAFAALPTEVVFSQFGKSGRFLHQLAQGKDTQPVPVRVLKPKLHLQKVLEGAIEDKTVVESLLQMMGCELEQQLKVLNLTTSRLDLTLILDDRSGVQTKRVLREATGNGKLIGRNLMRLFTSLELSSGVVEISVTALELVAPVIQQLDLFGTPCVNENRLTDLLEKLTTRFGNEGLYHVHELEPTHWLPELRYVFEKAAIA